MNAEYIYSSLYPSCPHFPTWYTPFSFPHSAHLLPRIELSPLSFSNEPQPLGKTSVSLANKPDNSFTRAVCGRFDMKRSSMLLFTAVESQLSERYAGSQLSHTVRRENHSIAAVTTDSCICLFNGQAGWGRSSLGNNVIDQEPASCKKLKRKMWIAFIEEPTNSSSMTLSCSYSKKWATSSYAFAPRRKGIVSFSTYRPYLSKEDEMVEWFSSLVMTSVAPDWNPALPRAGVFPLYFSSYYSKRVSKKSCWFGSISPFDLFLHLIIFILFCLVFYLRFKHHKSLPLQHCYSIHSQNYRD